MSKRIKTKTINLNQNKGIFSSIFNKIKGNKQSDVVRLRQVLSNEKARILYIIKTEHPDSIYRLSKILKRDFKAVRSDVKLLEHFGFIELVSSFKNGRERLRPVVDIDRVVITINL